MPFGFAAVAAASLAGSYMQADAAQNAANTQANAGKQSQAALLAAGQQAAGNYTPYQNLGQTAVNQLGTQMPYLTTPFTNQDLNANLAPNYAWQLQQGQQGNLAASNATGGMVSGNAQQALNQYNQNFASSAYQNAFNNAQSNQTNIYNRLNGIAGLGLNAATGTANAQLGTATNIASVNQGIANAQAGAQIAQGNAYASGLNSLGNVAYLGSQNMGSGGNTQLSSIGQNIQQGGNAGGGAFTPTAGNSFTLTE